MLYFCVCVCEAELEQVNLWIFLNVIIVAKLFSVNYGNTSLIPGGKMGKVTIAPPRIEIHRH